MNSLVTSHESVHHKTECGVAIHEVHGREPVKPFEEKQVLKLVQHKALEAFQQKKSDLLLAQPKKGKPSLYSIRLDHDAVLGLRNLVDSCDSASETGSPQPKSSRNWALITLGLVFQDGGCFLFPVHSSWWDTTADEG